jgi:hypothetical protein
VNTGGPSGTSPYDLQYYPTAIRKEQARIIELAVGQHVAGIDFGLPVLTERSTQVRVTRANGTAVGDASICVAYEGADDYEALAGRNCYARTDQKGLARISTYGRSQVRIYALEYDFSAPRIRPPTVSPL